MHCSLQIKTGHKTQCKSCCDRNVTFKYQEFQCNLCLHFAIWRIYFELCTWLSNKCKQQQNSLSFKKNYMILFIQKCKALHIKLLSILLWACYHLHQMTAVMTGDGKSVTSRQEEHLLGGRNARCWIVVPRKVQQIHQAEIQMLPLDLLDAFCLTHVVGYLNNLMSDLGILKACIQENLTVSSEFGGNVL